MKKILPLVTKRSLLLIFLSVYFILAFLTYKDFGTSLDEPDVYLRGKLLYNKVRGNDKVLQGDFAVNKGSNTGLIYYNHTYPAFLYALNGSEGVATYHLLNLLFGAVIFITMYELLFHIYKKQNLAIIAPLLLFFTPRFTGDIPTNPKDVPFTILYFVSLAAIFLYSEVKRAPWQDKLRNIVLGVLFGLTASQRMIGYSIYVIFFIYSFAGQKISRNYFAHLFLDTLTIFSIGFLVNLVSIPYLGADPLNHFVELIQVAKNFPWSEKVLFMGTHYPAPILPIFYLPVWIFISTPISILLLSPFAIRFKKSASLLFFLSLFVNLAIFFITKPVIYDGLRHVLFLVPQIVFMASITLVTLMKSRRTVFKYLILMLVAVNTISVAIEYIRLHPYEYIYFNELTGGLAGAHTKFETDYWGLSNKEAFQWLEKANGSSLAGKSVGFCSTVATVEPWTIKASAKPVWIDEKNKHPAIDYAICWERWDDNKMIKGTLLHTVTREGVPLVHIYQVKK